MVYVLSDAEIGILTAAFIAAYGSIAYFVGTEKYDPATEILEKGSKMPAYRPKDEGFFLFD